MSKTKLKLSVCLCFLAISETSLAAKFQCDSFVDALIDSDVESEISRSFDENGVKIEVTCRGGLGRVGCDAVRLNDIGEKKKITGVQVDGGSSRFRFRIPSGGEVNCRAVQHVHNDYYAQTCTSTDSNTGQVLDRFELTPFGPQKKMMVSGSPMVCRSELSAFTCMEGEGNTYTGGVEDLDFNLPLGWTSYYHPGVALDSAYFSLDITVGSRLVHTQCAAKEIFRRPAGINAPTVGIWEEIPNPTVDNHWSNSFPDFRRGRIESQTVFSEADWTGQTYDELTKSWGASVTVSGQTDKLCSYRLTSGDMRTIVADNLTEFAVADSSNGERVSSCVAWRNVGGESKWTIGGYVALPAPDRANGANLAVVDGKLFSWGVIWKQDSNGNWSKEQAVGLFNPETGSVEEITLQGAPSERFFPAIVAVSSEELLIWGGYSITWTPDFQSVNTAMLNDGAIYNIRTKKWRTVSSRGAHPGTAFWTGYFNLNTLSYAYATSVNGGAFIYGGWNPEKGFLHEGYIYDAADDSWQKVAQGPGSSLPGGMITKTSSGIAFLGVDPAFDGNWLYQPESNQWSKITENDRLKSLFQFQGRHLSSYDSRAIVRGYEYGSGTQSNLLLRFD